MRPKNHRNVNPIGTGKMNDEKPDWEPLPDSRPSLAYALFAVAVATGVAFLVAAVLDYIF